MSKFETSISEATYERADAEFPSFEAIIDNPKSVDAPAEVVDKIKKYIELRDAVANGDADDAEAEECEGLAGEIDAWRAEQVSEIARKMQDEADAALLSRIVWMENTEKELMAAVEERGLQIKPKKGNSPYKQSNYYEVFDEVDDDVEETRITVRISDHFAPNGSGAILDGMGVYMGRHDVPDVNIVFGEKNPPIGEVLDDFFKK